MDSAAGEAVTVRDRERVRYLTLNRPEKLNAINQAMSDALLESIRGSDSDADVDVLVFRGAGRAFCAGSDTAAMKERARARDEAGAVRVRLLETRERARIRERTRIVLSLVRSTKVTVAVLHGPVAGAGLAIALACDFRICAPDTTFVAGYPKLGIVADWGLTYLLPLAVGATTARQLLVGGRRFSVTDDAMAPLADFSTDAARSDGDVATAIEDIRQLNQAAVVESRALLHDERRLRCAMRREVRAVVRCQRSPFLRTALGRGQA